MEEVSRFDQLMEFVRSCIRRNSAVNNEVEVSKWNKTLIEFEISESPPESYAEYLQTDWWKHLREEALERALHRCQLCNNVEDLQVHHRKYPKRWGTEPVEDLTSAMP